MSPESEIRAYKPVEIDKLTQFDRLCSNFNSLCRRYQSQGTFWVTCQNMDGNPYSAVVNPKFLFGMYRARKALMTDLIDMGLKDDVKDIFEKYLREK